MAKRSRKDNWKKKRRQEHLELKEYQYYIFGEGQQTEPQYYTANNHCSEYSSFLNEKFTELGLGKYRKKMENIFEVLMEKGNPKLAIRYAKRLIKDGQGKTPTEIAAGTKVYELVEELAKYLPDEKKINFI